MVQLVDSLPATTEAELARFLRQQAEECLSLARDQPPSVASELLALAAMLHERAVRLESGAGHAAADFAG
jgi:hypothetical protein